MKEVICLDCGAVFSTVGVYARRCKVCAEKRRREIDRLKVQKKSMSALDRRYIANRESHSANMAWIAEMAKKARKNGMSYGMPMPAYGEQRRCMSGKI